MLRIINNALLITIFTIAGLNAGQIQIGGASGLTAAYVGAQGAGVGERTYSTTIFTTITENGSTPTYPSTSLTDSNNGVTFSIMNESGNTYWAINSNGSTPVTMTIPVGIFGITDVWTMLNDYWGITGSQNTSVTLNFGNSATVAGVGSQTFNFTNGAQIRDAIDCTGVAPGSFGGTAFPSPCTTFARTTTAGTTQAFTTAYNGDPTAAAAYFNTAGNLVLDDQALIVSSLFVNKYLVNIQVTNVNGGFGNSRAALSAITVGTPEPASVALFLSGFGALAFYGRRRCQSKV